MRIEKSFIETLFEGNHSPFDREAFAHAFATNIRKGWRVDAHGDHPPVSPAGLRSSHFRATALLDGQEDALLSTEGCIVLTYGPFIVAIGPVGLAGLRLLESIDTEEAA